MNPKHIVLFLNLKEFEHKIQNIGLGSDTIASSSVAGKGACKQLQDKFGKRFICISMSRAYKKKITGVRYTFTMQVGIASYL